MSPVQTPAIEALEPRKRYRRGEDVLRGGSFRVELDTILAYLGRNGGAQRLLLLALKPVRASRQTSHPDWVVAPMSAQAVRDESPINTTTTEEVST